MRKTVQIWDSWEGLGRKSPEEQGAALASTISFPGCSESYLLSPVQGLPSWVFILDFQERTMSNLAHNTISKVFLL